jgi:hypothetical protein
MTGVELRDVLRSPEFKEGLEELSSYLASIMQERPIVYLLAKCLWRQGHKFELEGGRCDLCLYDKRIEFKFNFDRCEGRLAEELMKHGDDLSGMWKLAQAKAINKSFAVMPRVYADVCVKLPDVFVWIICSRDLSKISPADLKRICMSREQCKYNAAKSAGQNGSSLKVVDAFLSKLQSVRNFRLLNLQIDTQGDFPSAYHFRICDFAMNSKAGNTAKRKRGASRA